MDALIGFDFGFHGEHCDKHNQGLWIFKGAPTRAIPDRFGKVRGLQKFIELDFGLCDPFRI
jgi:hypothetical protein